MLQGPFQSQGMLLSLIYLTKHRKVRNNYFETLWKFEKYLTDFLIVKSIVRIARQRRNTFCITSVSYAVPTRINSFQINVLYHLTLSHLTSTMTTDTFYLYLSWFFVYFDFCASYDTVLGDPFFLSHNRFLL